jgi:hypothetical protein
VRTLKFALILFCVLGVASAITGIESAHSDPSGTVITRHTGFGRLFALAIAGVFAVAWFGVHRRLPIAWKLGWVVLAVSVFAFLFETLSFAATLNGTERFVLSAGVVLGAFAVAAYWGIWWRRHREYFMPDGAPPGWSPDLTPLRWFGIGMFTLGLIVILITLLLR